MQVKDKGSHYLFDNFCDLSYGEKREIIKRDLGEFSRGAYGIRKRLGESPNPRARRKLDEFKEVLRGLESEVENN